MIASAAAALGTQVSQLFKSAIWVLEKLDLADFTGNTFAGWLMWLFSPKGAQALFVLFLAAFFIAVIRMLYVNQRPQQPAEGVNVPAASGQELKDRIKELEEKNATLEGRIETLNAQHQSEKAGLEKQIEGLNQEVRKLQGNTDTLQMSRPLAKVR